MMSISDHAGFWIAEERPNPQGFNDYLWIEGSTRLIVLVEETQRPGKFVSFRIWMEEAEPEFFWTWRFAKPGAAREKWSWTFSNGTFVINDGRLTAGFARLDHAADWLLLRVKSAMAKMDEDEERAALAEKQPGQG